MLKFNLVKNCIAKIFDIRYNKKEEYKGDNLAC